jgi:hypothetical protein
MCVFVGNAGSVVANLDSFPLTVEIDAYCIYINGICVYADYDAEEGVIEDVYSDLMQMLAVTIKDEYPTDKVKIFQVGV